MFKVMPYWVAKLAVFLLFGGIIGIVPAVLIESTIYGQDATGIGAVICVCMMGLSMILCLLFKDFRDNVLFGENKPKYLQAQADGDIVFCQGKRYKVHFIPDSDDIRLEHIKEDLE